MLLLLIDDDAAATFWRLDTRAGAVIVSGPELVRSATLREAVLELTGDTATAAPLEVWGPRYVGVVLWNGRPVATSRTSAGSVLSGCHGRRYRNRPCLIVTSASRGGGRCCDVSTSAPLGRMSI